MAGSGKDHTMLMIKKQLKAKKVKRDVDVKELYLSKGDGADVADLSRFKNLTQLWLNENKLQAVTCLWQNFRLSELYLQHNQLKDISGCLQHLTCLKVLFLHNNQLEKLDRVIHEFRKMQNLHVLNLFNNPVAQEQEYRVYVVHHIPSLQLLDRHEVLKLEQDLGNKLYNQSREEVNDSVAFGRRSQGPPALYYRGGKEMPKHTTPMEYEVGNNFYRDNPPFATEEQAINARALRTSLMEHSYFDWSKVPRALERRTTDKQFGTPQLVTTTFR